MLVLIRTTLLTSCLASRKSCKQHLLFGTKIIIINYSLQCLFIYKIYTPPFCPYNVMSISKPTLYISNLRHSSAYHNRGEKPVTERTDCMNLAMEIKSLQKYKTEIAHIMLAGTADNLKSGTDRDIVEMQNSPETFQNSQQNLTIFNVP